MARYSADEWYVAFRPVTENPGKKRGTNDSGLQVLLTDGDEQHEVARVAFRRKDSSNPETSFEDQLAAETAKAEEAAEALNAMLDELDRLRQEEMLKARERVREIFGEADGGLA